MGLIVRILRKKGLILFGEVRKSFEELVMFELRVKEYIKFFR